MAIVQEVQNGKLVDTSASATTDSTVKAKETSTLGQQDFLQLLVAEMQYQDPLEPQSNTDYIAQLATFTQVQDIEDMQTVVKGMQASNLVGKYVILKVTSPTTGVTNYVSGSVDYVSYEGGKTYLSVNGGLYSLDDLDTVTTNEYSEAATLISSLSSMLAALPKAENLTLANEEALKKARTLYDSLTASQKKYVTDDQLKKLLALEAQMKVLKGTDKDEAASGDGAGTGSSTGSGESTGTGSTSGTGSSTGNTGA